MREILRLAAAMGLTVHAAHLEPGVLGEYYAVEREVYFDMTLAPDEQVCVIAHELGHYHHGHQCDGDPATEAQADEFAARLLVDPTRFAELEHAGLCIQDIAEEMGITMDVATAFVTRCLTRLGRVTYVRSKMGAGQWAHREQIA